MRRAITVLSLLLTVGATAAHAQENFSGHWVQEVLGAGPDNGGGGGGGRRGAPNPQQASSFGSDFLVIQDGKTLTVKRLDTTSLDTVSNVYAIDGSESKNGGMFSRGTIPGATVSTAKWDGKKLIITSKGGFVGATGNATGTTTTTLYMKGKQLWIQSDRPGNNGNPGASLLGIFNRAK